MEELGIIIIIYGFADSKLKGYYTKIIIYMQSLLYANCTLNCNKNYFNTTNCIIVKASTIKCQ